MVYLVCLCLQKEYLEREMEKRFIRTNPLGKDRDYNRYWFFRKDSRIFVESSDHKQWGYYTTKTEVSIILLFPCTFVAIIFMFLILLLSSIRSLIL